MFADWVKIALKTALVVGIIAGVIALFNIVQVPAVNDVDFIAAVSFAYTVACHWCPILPVLLPLFIMIFNVNIAIWLYKISVLGIRALYGINE